jgi:hypothetical protein
MAYQRIPKLKIEDARIIFRNFSGKEGPYNRAGDRSFNVIIEDPELAETLAADGWNIKTLPKRDEDETPNHRLEVAVSYKKIPPNITLVSGHKKVRLDEEAVNALDYADIESVDLLINPSYWEVNGKTGIKAYLYEMYVVVRQDEFADKYAGYDE